MEFSSLGVTGVAAITVLCLLIGQTVKASGIDSKWIPVLCGLSGLLLGVAGRYLMPDFPAADHITAAAVGTASGLAATGVNQAFKQMRSDGSGNS